MSQQYVYFIRPVGMDGPVKIGCSARPTTRKASLQCWSPFPLEVVAQTEGNVRTERRFHRLFYASHSHGEWFHGTPELSVVIEAINAGTFDPATLPPYAGKLDGMQERVSSFTAIDYEYLVAVEDYWARDFRASGYIRGHVYDARTFARLKSQATKEAALKRLRDFLDERQAA